MRTYTLSTRGLLAFLLLASCTPDATPPPEQTVTVLRDIQLTTRARTPENDGMLVSVDVTPDGLVFHYSGPPQTPLAVGDIVAGVTGGGYLRELTTITETSPHVFACDTTHAELVDYISSGHFHVHHDPRTSSWQTSGDVTVAALESGVTLLPAELNDACTLSSGGSVDVHPILDMDVDFDIDIDIDVDVDFWPPRARGRLVSSDFIIHGSLEVGAEVEASTNGEISCELDLIDYAREHHIRVPKHEWTTTFVVGVVPVVITHEVGPTASVSITGSVQTSGATARGSSTFDVRAGAQYRDDGMGWRSVWEPSRTGSGSFTVNEPGDVTISAEVTLGIEYEGKIYDVIGPKVGLEGSLEGSFTANTCMWNGEVKAGISLTGGGSIEIPVIDQTLVEFTMSQELASITIWEDEGTWPWCEDSGVDAGVQVTQPGDDAGTGTGTGMDAGTGMGGDSGGSANPCLALSCYDCVASADCTYCPGDGNCYQNTAAGACSGGTTNNAGACDTCHDLGGTCTDRFECCNASTNGAIACIDSFCEDTTMCVMNGGGCTELVTHCCGLGICSPNTGGTTVCCSRPGDRCAADGDCCGYEHCVGGLCQAQAVGQPCQSTQECDGAAYCLDTHVCGF